MEGLCHSPPPLKASKDCSITGYAPPPPPPRVQGRTDVLIKHRHWFTYDPTPPAPFLTQLIVLDTCGLTAKSVDRNEITVQCKYENVMFLKRHYVKQPNFVVCYSGFQTKLTVAEGNVTKFLFKTLVVYVSKLELHFRSIHLTIDLSGNSRRV